MSKTAAQRQSEYRSRRDDGEGERRINTWVTCTTYFALKRLAKRHGVSRRCILEQLIYDADAVILKTLEPNTKQWDEYFDTPRRLVTQ
jgi:hypothetical protein